MQLMVDIPTQEIIHTDAIKPADEYGGLRLIRLQTNPTEKSNYINKRYQFQHDIGKHSVVKAVVSRKGAPSEYRICATLHLSVKQFFEVVKYNPENPPKSDYKSQGMIQAHERTQSDFKGQKEKNAAHFADYLLEGVRGERRLNLPVISGWQSKISFPDTVFAAWDENNPNALYGDLYLPKDPVMQSDGQTQTAALFRLDGLLEAKDALDQIMVTLEVEFNVDEELAGQSFADRNGRGSKKNLNLVKNLDIAAGMSRLRAYAVKDTIFGDRLADGRGGGTSETATKNIVDLSTMEQMLLLVISGGNLKPENIKYHQVEYLLPFARDFLKLEEQLFGPQWPEKTPDDSEAFRKLYVHGWPFCQKAIALAYHRARFDEIGPYLRAIRTEHEVQDGILSAAQKFELKAEEHKKKLEAQKKDGTAKVSEVSISELEDRLKAIDWYRHRKHWIALTGYAMQGGSKKTRELTIDGMKQTVVMGLAQNTKAAIDNVASKLLSDTWNDLTKTENEPL